MQKIILDTNVLISSLIQRGYSYLIVNDIIIEDKAQLFISDELMAEYYEVLSRERFSKYPRFLTESQTLLAYIEKKAERVFPKIKVNIIGDPDDNKLLELAEESGANFLITGNTNDFTMTQHKMTRITTPKEYWDNHRP